MTIEEFQEKYPTKEEKEQALAAMTNEQISELINQTNNVQAKIFYAKWLKNTWYEPLARLNTEILLEAVGENADKNVVTSAVSLYILLGLVMNAAGGKTNEEIKEIITGNISKEANEGLNECQGNAGTNEDLGEDVLNTTLKDLQQTLGKKFSGGELHLANGIVLDKSLADKVKEDFSEIMKNNYNAEIFSCGFDVLHVINDWCYRNTNGMIPKLLGQVPMDFKMCFLNAVAFEAKWLTPYEEDQITEDDEFTNVDGIVSKVTMLNSTEDCYIEDDFYTGFIKPYKGEKYALMALLPKKARSKTFLKRAIQNTDFRKLFRSGRDAEVSVEMPEFEMNQTMELSKLVRNMGAETMFTRDADFSGIVDSSEITCSSESAGSSGIAEKDNIARNENIVVDSIVQKAYIKVNREGTKAAAVTAVVCVAGCAPDFDRNKYVRLDRPFVYAVMEVETGVPVFAGVVNRL